MFSALVVQAERLDPAGPHTSPLTPVLSGMVVSGWLDLLTCQLAFPRANVSREPNGSCMTFSDLVLEVHLLLDYKQVIGQLRFKEREMRFYLFLKSCPGWCGSVDLMPACKPKGCRFDFQSGHAPGLRDG